MLGNLAEAVLTLGMLLTIPAVVVLIVLLVLRLGRDHRSRNPSGRVDGRKAAQPPAVVCAMLSMFVGGALGFLSLEAFYGIVLALVTAVLLFRQDGRRRWFAIGGFTLGMGLCAAGFLSPALTNHDPAVEYDPSTIPVFWLACVVALCGAVTLAVVATAASRNGPAR